MANYALSIETTRINYRDLTHSGVFSNWIKSQPVLRAKKVGKSYSRILNRPKKPRKKPIRS